MQGLQRGQCIDIQLPKRIGERSFGSVPGFEQLQLKRTGRTRSGAGSIRVGSGDIPPRFKSGQNRSGQVQDGGRYTGHAGNVESKTMGGAPGPKDP